MTRRYANAFLGTALTLLLMLTPVATAQTPAGSSSAQNAATQATPTFKVTTRLVVVDVVATDKKGVAIKDLKVEDFSILEENHPQKIRAFSFQAPAQEAAAAPAKLPPNRITNTPTFKSGGPLNVVLIDGLNISSPQKLKYAKDEMLKMLEKLPAGQPVAVYALGSKLRLLQDFTTDPGLLKTAIHSLKSRSAPRLDSSIPASDPAIIQALQEMNMQSMIGQITAFQQDNEVYQTDYRVRLTLAALRGLARHLSGYSGRKNLIWVSDVFPSYLYPELNPTQGVTSLESQGRAARRDYSLEIEQTSDALSNAHIAVYPVDTRAVGNTDPYSNLSNTDAVGTRLGRSNQADNLSRAVNDPLDSHITMNTIADSTGGRAFYNTNDLDGAIRQGLEDGSTYYTLGYYPEDKNWDGKFRKIVVKVERRGVKLRFRQGYYAADPHGYGKMEEKKRAMDFGLALNMETPVSTALLFQAAIVPQNGNRVQVNYGIDAHGISFDLSEDGVQHASVDCAVEVYSKKRESKGVRGNTFNADLPPEQYQLVMQKFLPCNQVLELPDGEYVLRLGVRDNHTGMIGTANASLTVPASPVAAAEGTGPAK
ncbi:MAG TPA: VWA domain-containing protein [Candidatus Angelobacter sp.]